MPLRVHEVLSDRRYILTYDFTWHNRDGVPPALLQRGVPLLVRYNTNVMGLAVTSGQLWARDPATYGITLIKRGVGFVSLPTWTAVRRAVGRELINPICEHCYLGTQDHIGDRCLYGPTPFTPVEAR